MALSLHIWKSPVTERELRLVSRKWQTYWERAGAGAVAILVAAGFLSGIESMGRAASAGLVTFQFLAFIVVFYLPGRVLKASAPAFVREKAGDTLGLLFLTPLRPWEILLGKLAATSLPIIYQLIAMLPVLSLPLLVGGVTLANFLILVIGALNLVLLSAAIGLWTSATLWDENGAAGAGLLLLIIISVVVPGGPSAIAFSFDWGSAPSLLALSPYYPIWHATMATPLSSWWVGVSFLCTQAWFWLFIWATCRVLPTCWQKTQDALRQTVSLIERQALTPEPRQKPASEASTRQPIRTFTPEQRRQMLHANPAVWLASRRRPTLKGLWALGGVWAALPLVACVVSGKVNPLFNPPLIFCICVGFNFVLLSFVRKTTGAAFAMAQSDNPLDLLLSTTISPRDLVDGYRTVLQNTLRPTLGATFVIELVWLSSGLVFSFYAEGNWTWLWAIAAAGMLGLFAQHVRMVQWWGLWKGVIGRTPREAESDAPLASAAPWLLFGIIFVLVQMIDTASAFLLAITSWIASSWFINRWIIKVAQRNLWTRLRLWAMRRVAGDLEHYDDWRKLGRWIGTWYRKVSEPDRLNRCSEAD